LNTQAGHKRPVDIVQSLVLKDEFVVGTPEHCGGGRAASANAVRVWLPNSQRCIDGHEIVR